jgi:hypothetical protein
MTSTISMSLSTPSRTITVSSIESEGKTTITFSVTQFGILYGYELALSNLPAAVSVTASNKVFNWISQTASQNQAVSIVAADFSLSNPINTNGTSSSSTILATLVINQTGISSLLDLSNFSLTTKNSLGQFSDLNFNAINYQINLEGRNNILIHDTLGSNVYNANGSRDTLSFTSPRSNYKFTRTGSTTFVTDMTLGSTDTVSGFARLNFSDGGIAYDLNDSAGTVAKILGAVFGSEAIGSQNYVGIGLRLLDQGYSKEALINLALNTRLGNAYSTMQEVDLLYKNLMHRPPTDQEASFWTNQLDNKVYSPAGLAQLACDSTVNTENINLVGLTLSGIAYS